MTDARSETVVENIQAIIRMEEQSARQRSPTDRAADAIASFAGTVTFVVLHLVWFAAWTAFNVGWIPLGAKPFDPYPFQLLSLIVSLEAVLLSTFVLIKQNRMGLRSDRRNHLDLQINLLTEKEVTKVIQMLEGISAHLGIEHGVVDRETQELGEVTAVGDLAQELQRSLPEEA